MGSTGRTLSSSPSPTPRRGSPVAPTGVPSGPRTPTLIRRAFAAYFRAGGTDQPANTSTTVVHEGKLYVVLHNVNGVLAVYRVLNKGTLKGLKRWPKEIEEHFA